MIYAALFGWPIIMVILARKLPWPQALVFSIIGGYLLLPEQGFWFDPPILSPIGKEYIPGLVAVVLALVLRPEARSGQAVRPGAEGVPQISALAGWLPRSVFASLGLLLIIGGALGTVFTNGDTLTFAQTTYTRPGLQLYDGFAEIGDIIAVLLPMLLARKYLAHPDQHRQLLWGICICALIYSLPALFEIRMSPRLNVMIYGFFPHSWIQHLRPGGFRPLVFLEHGLLLAIFFAMSILALVALARTDARRRKMLVFGALWVLGTLAISNSLTGLIVALILLPAVLVLGPRMQLLLAALVAAFVLAYPSLRMADQIPTVSLVDFAQNISSARAASLEFRFDNEDLILEHIRERALLGWGGFGRNRLYDEFGRGIDTIDGTWISVLSQGGWIGFFGFFGLLCIPLILTWFHGRRYEITLPTAALCVILAGNLIDLLPNSGLSPVTWLIAGALLGRLELGKIAAAAPADVADAEAAEDPGGLVSAQLSPYSRQRTRHIRNIEPDAAATATRERVRRNLRGQP